MSKVKVTADQNGNVVGVSQNNPEYGYIRVEQQAIQINEQGWLKNVKRSALLKGKVIDLLETGYKAETELPGKIVVVESLTPFNTENPDRDLKVAGLSGVICRIDDEPIYRQSFYSSNPNAFDQLLSHNNNTEIKDVMSAQQVMTLMNSQSKEETTL